MSKNISSTVPNQVENVTAPAVESAAPDIFGSLVIAGGRTLKSTRSVTRPVLRQIDGVPVAVEFVTRFALGEELKRVKRDGTPMMAPVQIASVINLETGEDQTLIGNVVLVSELDKNYKDGAYVGKYFGIVSRTLTRPDGRKVREYGIKELIFE